MGYIIELRGKKVAQVDERAYDDERCKVWRFHSLDIHAVMGAISVSPVSSRALSMATAPTSSTLDPTSVLNTTETGILATQFYRRIVLLSLMIGGSLKISAMSAVFEKHFMVSRALASDLKEGAMNIVIAHGNEWLAEMNKPLMVFADRLREDYLGELFTSLHGEPGDLCLAEAKAHARETGWVTSSHLCLSLETM